MGALADAKSRHDANVINIHQERDLQERNAVNKTLSECAEKQRLALVEAKDIAEKRLQKELYLKAIEVTDEVTKKKDKEHKLALIEARKEADKRQQEAIKANS